jgi:hypothetical protein
MKPTKKERLAFCENCRQVRSIKDVTIRSLEGGGQEKAEQIVIDDGPGMVASTLDTDLELSEEAARRLSKELSGSE